MESKGGLLNDFGRTKEENVSLRDYNLLVFFSRRSFDLVLLLFQYQGFANQLDSDEREPSLLGPNTHH